MICILPYYNAYSFFCSDLNMKWTAGSFAELQVLKDHKKLNQ